MLIVISCFIDSLIMIREVKINKGNSKKYNKNNKKNYKNKVKHSRQTKKNDARMNNDKNVRKVQDGGSNCKERDNFEVTTLSNVDASKFSVSKYVNANIDWGIMPGPPPTDCVVM